MLFVAVLVLPLWAGEEGTVFEIPKLAEIVVDGKADEWGGKGLAIGGLKPAAGPARSAPNFDAKFHMGWDERGILLLVQVTDDTSTEPAQKIEEIWKGDSIEAFFAAERGKSAAYQAVLAPGRGGEKKELRFNLSDYRKDFKDKLTLEAKSSASETGYTVEILFPWANLKVEPKVGLELAAQLFANDLDGEGERYQIMWYPKPDAHLDTNNMQRIKLGEGK
jgi:hypothetical protein